MSEDPLARHIAAAFYHLCEAEELIYAAGMKREVKDDAIQAHSILLRLRQRFVDAKRMTEPLKR